jgi:hypothetical protein
MNEPNAIWERYVASWKAVDAADKQRLFAGCLSPSCVYTDPQTVAKGWTELSNYMLDFQKQIPGGHFVTQQFITHHGRSMARWNMVGGDGAVLGDGVSYGEYGPDGKLVSMTGFFETPNPSPT